jgi:formate dehydrogenase major subunit
MGGMTWERLEREESLTYPLREPGDPGEPVIFQDAFPTDDRRGRFVPVDYREADELPDGEFPIVFTTGRQLEHWHTGSMTRRAPILDAIEPIPVVSVHPRDLESAGVPAGGRLVLESRRGALEATARADAGVQPGMVFMAFCYQEAAANLLTNPALDPYGKIPEFKFCAVRLRPAAATA